MTNAVLERLIIGESSAIRSVRDTVTRVAPAKVPVLVAGETGAGKELVAEALHLVSGRKAPFVAFNVCAIGDSMFEDALFGHVRGAFTGALSDRRGYLSEADGGTAFFDEVTGLALHLQPKLLRAIETGAFRPVGAGNDRRSDFRVVSATNEAVEGAVRSGRLRADLAHRLTGFVIHVPPLRQRLEDIPILARTFAARVAAVNAAPVEFSAAAVRALQSHGWPGNVRELKNVVECAILLAPAPRVEEVGVLDVLSRSAYPGYATESQAAERGELEQLLQAFEWDTERAANALSVHRSTMYRRMRRLGVRVPVMRSLPQSGDRPVASARPWP